jgi:2-iminobutanoate/2-iminopropanoate deaminase
VASGELIFVSGQIGQRGGSFEEEVQTTLDNVEARLAEAGASFDDVVQATVYLTDMDNYAEFNTLYGARLGDPYPARACIEVSRLPGDARVEVQVIARRPR